MRVNISFELLSSISVIAAFDSLRKYVQKSKVSLEKTVQNVMCKQGLIAAFDSIRTPVAFAFAFYRFWRAVHNFTNQC